MGSYHTYTIYPAYGYVTKREQMLKACETISAELKDRLKYFEDNMKPLEYERLDQRTRHDVEMLREVGMCPGIEDVYKRQPERFIEPGGNVHYERFLETVLKPLSKHQTVHYQRFDCHQMAYQPVIDRPYHSRNIIEGTYA